MPILGTMVPDVPPPLGMRANQTNPAEIPSHATMVTTRGRVARWPESPLPIPAASNIERHVREAAAIRRVKVVMYALKDRAGLERAFADMERNRPDAVIGAGGSGFLFGNRRFTVESALRLHLPYAGGGAEVAADGGLFSYGTNLRASFRSAALFAARLLKGANPAEMPIEQPTVFELVINLKTAKALGIKIPQSLLLRADRVIE